MSSFRKELIDLIRPELKGPMSREFVSKFDAILDRCDVPRDAADEPVLAKPAATLSKPSDGRLGIASLRERIGLCAAGTFDAEARRALFARLSNPAPSPLSDADFKAAADDLGVAVGIIRAVRKVEAPRGPFDEQGRPSILFERHVFARNTVPKGRFSTSHPLICGGPYGPGGYGKFAAQYAKLGDACALDPEAAFRACSWGAFQVLGENAVAIGYKSAFDMALSLTKGEAAHLESFVRFVKSNKLVEALRACRPGNPTSCIPFVKAYNGKDFAAFDYHKKLAQAAL